MGKPRASDKREVPMSLRVCEPDGPSAPEMTKTCPHLALSNLQSAFPDAEPLELISKAFRIISVSTKGQRRKHREGHGAWLGTMTDPISQSLAELGVSEK